jgi:sulfur carrier protein ThiS
MKLQVFLHDTLKRRTRPGAGGNGNSLELTMPAGSFVADLLELLELPEEWVGLIIINGKQAGNKEELKNGDKVDLFSPMAGG